VSVRFSPIMNRLELGVLLAAALAMVACGKPATDADSRQSLVVPLSQMNSGYIGDPERMTRFLRCWQKEVGAEAVQPTDFGVTIPATDPRLPRSLRDFHVAKAQIRFRSLYEQSNPGTERYADPRALVPFKQFSEADFSNWKSAFAGMNEPDASYFRYDRSQQGFRERDLDSMLVAGAETGGAFYLLIPRNTTRDGESEALFLHHGGLVSRYKSFAHLLASLYLEERERFAGRDPSLGHLYYFPGRLGETCVSHVIDTSM